MSKELEISNVLDKHLSPIQIDGATVPIELSTNLTRFTTDVTFAEDINVEGQVNILGGAGKVAFTEGLEINAIASTGYVNFYSTGINLAANQYTGIDGDILDNDSVLQLTSSPNYDAVIKFFNSIAIKWSIGNDGDDSDTLKFDNQSATVGGGTKLALDSDGNSKQEGSISLKEKASAIADTAAYGQLWVKNETPNELYFTTDAGDDIQLTDGTSAAGGGGGGTDTYCFSTTARCRMQYNNWYYPNTAYGLNYYYWVTTLASTSLATSWNDSYCPGFIVPRDGEVKSYTIIGNITTTDTMEWAILKGTGVTPGSAGNWTLSNVGATQSAGGTANIMYKWEQTGLSTSVSAGDMILPAFRRTTDNDSSYSYCEIGLSVIME
tara:strand:+ start:420 stop:1559 length:1140 start_codon:yes stop_codon:yes gene_type:complete